MKDKIDTLLKRIDALLADNLSRDDALGMQNGFHEVERIKNTLSTTLRDLLKALPPVLEILPAHFLQTKVGHIESYIGAVEGLKKQVEECAKIKTQDPRFHHVRSQLHNSARQQETANEASLDELRLAILTAQASAATAHADFSQQQAAATQMLAELTRIKEKADKVMEALKDQAAKKTYQVSQTGYSRLSENHKVREWSWFGAAALSMALLAAAVSYVIWGQYSATTMEEVVLLVTRKLFMLSVPLLLLRISLTKYNVERFLRIVYDHRNAAVAQLQLLEAAIDDDRAAKAELRLEAAKMILSDPIASYGQQADSSEINISPVFSTLEKLSGKG